LRLLFVLCFSLWLGAGGSVRAQSAPLERPAPTQIKADLDRILASPEFRPPAAESDGFLARAARWIGEKGSAFWRRFGRLFGVSHVSGGSAGLQWVFIALFLGLGIWLLAKLISAFVIYRSPHRRAPQTARVADEFETETVTEPDLWIQQAQRYAADGD